MPKAVKAVVTIQLPIPGRPLGSDNHVAVEDFVMQVYSSRKKGGS